MSTPPGPGWTRLPDGHPLSALVGAAAAAADGRQILTGLGHRVGGRAYEIPGPLVGVLAEWQNMLAARLGDGTTTTCPHLDTAHPQPMVWLRYAPELLGCRNCAASAAETTLGTPEDDVCDRCRAVTVHGQMHVIAGEIPAAVFRFPGASLPLGPILLQGGLCDACADADQMLSEAAASAVTYAPQAVDKDVETP
jgi:hypothetical protein